MDYIQRSSINVIFLKGVTIFTESILYIGCSTFAFSPADLLLINKYSYFRIWHSSSYLENLSKLCKTEYQNLQIILNLFQSLSIKKLINTRGINYSQHKTTIFVVFPKNCTIYVWNFISCKACIRFLDQNLWISPECDFVILRLYR